MLPDDAKQHKLRVLLTGGSGFVGSYVLRALRARNYAVRVLRRSPGDFTSSDSGSSDPGIEAAPGDVTDPDSSAATSSEHFARVITQSARFSGRPGI